MPMRRETRARRSSKPVPRGAGVSETGGPGGRVGVHLTCSTRAGCAPEGGRASFGGDTHLRDMIAEWLDYQID